MLINPSVSCQRSFHVRKVGVGGDLDHDDDNNDDGDDASPFVIGTGRLE
eukprot:CAMPEP_0167821186 /NCGR_PEP_ID=MMETSP0112_2-20121227/6625_1 /TAXON_ID=91324 /ORGANISM="Lotharella globosa, Strain CCCM811" /LENGTH=48 /DNA_ID= /DNA_START= /DNA_END= /DNA_ORIENTATION=